jgi:hypothetical protein
VTAGRPLRTNRSRRPLDGLYGRGDLRDEGIGGTRRRDKRPGLDVELAPGGSPISGWDWIASG